MFNLASLGAGNYSQITLNLQLTGIVQETSPGVRTYNLTSFPFVDVTGGVLTNATASLGLPAGVNVTTDFTQYGFTQALAGTPSYTLVFTNNTVPQVSFVPVSYVQPDILFSVNNKVAIDNFGWVYTDTTVTVNNTGQAATGNLDANLTYFGLYVPYTWNQSSSSTLISTQETNTTTSYMLSLPSIAAGGSAQLLLHLKTWGMINEFTAGTYTYNLTNFPIVGIPGGGLYNATSLISLPVATTVSSDLTQYGFVQQPPANPTYEQFFTEYTEPVPTVYSVNFTATSSDNFGLFQIDSVQRTVGMAGDGSVLVTDTVSITNFDTQDLSTFNLTLPISGQYSLKMGWVDGGYITLSDGLITLPVPISASSLQNLVIQYTLPSSAVKDNSGTITIDLGAGALNYTNLVQSYSVIFSFPSGTVAQASTPTSFVNQSVMPEVVLTAKVPLGWNLYLAAPAIVGLLIAAVFIFFLYRRANLEPFEEDGVSIIQAKADVITSLLEQYRLRGEGFSSFDDYSAKRRSLEEEKTKVDARLQEYKVKGAEGQGSEVPLREDGRGGRPPGATLQGGQGLPGGVPGDQAVSEGLRRQDSRSSSWRPSPRTSSRRLSRSRHRQSLLNNRVLESFAAAAAPSLGQGGDERGQEPLHLLHVVLKGLHDLLGADGPVGPDVVVGHHGHRHVAHPLLSGQVHLGHQGHPYHMGTPGLEQRRLRPGAETGPFDADVGPPPMESQRESPALGMGHLAHLRAEGVRERNVGDLASIVEGALSLLGHVYELVGEDDLARLYFGLQAAYGRGGDDAGDAQLLQGPDVCPVVDPVRWDPVALPVPGYEGHLPAFEVAQGHPVRRVAEGRVHLDLLGVPEHGDVVDAGASDDAYLRFQPKSEASCSAALFIHDSPEAFGLAFLTRPSR